MKRRLNYWVLGFVVLLASIAATVGLRHIQCWVKAQPSGCMTKVSEPLSYETLERQLQNQQWQAADQTTYRLLAQAARSNPNTSARNSSSELISNTLEPMSNTVDGQDSGWLTPDLMLQIPCADLQKIDQLWMKYSDSRFGFSVQQQIRDEILSRPIYDPTKALKIRLGWLKSDGSEIDYAQYPFSLKAPQGQFPTLTQYQEMEPGAMMTIQWNPSLFFYRVKSCLVSPTPQASATPLKSNRRVDYSTLQALLESQEWQLAGSATSQVITLAVKGSADHYQLTSEEVAQIPCDVLQKVDQLWVRASQGRFGLKAQRQVWEKISPLKVDGMTEFNLNHDAKFIQAIGWFKEYPYATPISQVEFGKFPQLVMHDARFYRRVKACSL